MKKREPNRLIGEKSPYLLQHAYNPVDWYPWCDEAFERAKKEDKPILLSIGYSSCHWCHVMEKESFEDEEIAEIINKNYIAIKVDREERPDIDSIYMKACIALTGMGGWPLTVFLTPDKRPFFAGTYFPKESYYGRIGFKDLLIRISVMWKEEREKLIENSKIVVEHLKKLDNKDRMSKISERILDEAYILLEDSFDWKYGGFGRKPKFPTPHNLLFLLRYWKRSGKITALEMVEKTLKTMRLGGIFDHIGYGFHRYSTDEKWLLPHFEKMLYDQAMLLMVYTEAYQATGNKFYRNVAEEIVDYLIREMRDENGGFYSSQDADSEGEEGKYYLWTYEELKNILKDDFEFFKALYGVEKEGNFREEASGKLSGKNVLYLRKTLEEISRETGKSIQELRKFIDRIRMVLSEHRKKKVPPHKDDKILADWNGLVIVALVKAGKVMKRHDWIEMAEKAVEFIFDTMLRGVGVIYHRYRDGDVDIPGYLDDYAFISWGLIELYGATFKAEYLKKSIELVDYAIEHFWDEENGGFFFTSDNFHSDIIIREKEVYDGAYPSGNSVMLSNLSRLWKLTGRDDFRHYAEQMIRAFASKINEMPNTYTMFLIGYDFLVNETTEIVICSSKENDEVREILEAYNRKFDPFTVVLLKYPNSGVEEIAEYTKNLKEVNGQVTAYLCKNFSCSLPSVGKDQIFRSIID